MGNRERRQLHSNHGGNRDMKISALLHHVQTEQDTDGNKNGQNSKGARTGSAETDQCIHDVNA